MSVKPSSKPQLGRLSLQLTGALFVVFALLLVFLVISDGSRASTNDSGIIGIEIEPLFVDEPQTLETRVELSEDLIDEFDISFKIELNGDLVEESITTIDPNDGTDQSIPFTWTPSLPGNHHFQARILHDDSNLDNNTFNDIIYVREPVNEPGFSTYTYDDDDENGRWWPVDEGTLTGDGWRFSMDYPNEDRYGSQQEDGLVSDQLHLSPILANAELWFHHKASLANGDVGAIQISTDDDPYDTNWYTQYTTSSVTLSDWTFERVDLTPWIGKEIRFQFRFTSDAKEESQGWWIDNVRVVGSYIRHDISIDLVEGADHVMPATDHLTVLSIFNKGILDEDLDDLTIYYTVLHQDQEMDPLDGPISYITIKGELLKTQTSIEALFNLDVPTEPGLYTVFINATIPGEEKPRDNTLKWPLVVGKTIATISGDANWRELEPGVLEPTDIDSPPYQITSASLNSANEQLGLVWTQREPSQPLPWIKVQTEPDEMIFTALQFTSQEYLDTRKIPCFVFMATLPSELTRQQPFQVGMTWNEPVTLLDPELVMFGKAGPWLDLEDDDIELFTGRSTDIELEIINQGLGTIEMELSILDIPEGWTCSLNRDLINAQPLSSNIARLTLEPSNTVDNHVEGSFTITVILNTRSPELEISRTINIDVPPPRITLTRWTSDHHSLLGEQTAIIDLQLTNEGSVATDLDIKLYKLSKESTVLLYSRTVADLENGEVRDINFEYTSEMADNGQNNLQVVIEGPQLSQQFHSTTLSIHVLKEAQPSVEDDSETEPPVDTGVIAGIALLSSIAMVGVVGLKNETLKFTITKGILPLWLPLYTRLRQDDMLDNEVRDNLYQFIMTNPGSNYSTIMRELNLKNGLFAYHLFTLEREKYIISQHEGIYRRFYPSNKTPDFQKNLLTSRIDNEMKAVIVRLVQKEPGLSQSQIAKQLGESRQRINYHVNKLVEDRVLNIRRNGRTSSLFLNPLYSKIMEQ